MINSIMLDNIGKHISAATPLTRIALLQVLISEIFYNPHLEFSEQENMDVMQQFFVHFTKECENMEIWLPQKLTLLGLTYILPLPTLALPASTLLAKMKLISLVVTMSQNMKEDSDNPRKHHDDDGIINDKA